MISVNLLPKGLRRVKEPGYWRLVAALIPVVALAVAFTLQVTANSAVKALESEVQALEDRIVLLRPALAEQTDLQNRQMELRELAAIAAELRRDRFDWTESVVGLLETLPASAATGERRIDFSSLNVTAVVPPRADPARFEGRPVVAEMAISGNVRDTDILANFIRALEDSSGYGVAFQRADRQEEQQLYSYSLTVGMHEGAADETR